MWINLLPCFLPFLYFCQGMMNPDPIGAALLAYFGGDKKAEVAVESSITEDESIPAWYLLRSYEQMPDLEKIALKRCKGKVLDIGACAGSHSLHLQEKGIDVTAIDLSHIAVEVMKKRGVREVRQGDFFDLDTSEKFDTLLLLMNGIGIVGDLKGLDDFFQFVPKLLNPGGQILLDSSDIIYMYEEEDGSVWLNLNDSYYGEIEYKMAFEQVKGYPFDWLYIDFDLLAIHAEKAGLRAEKIFAGEDYDYLARVFV